MAAEIEEARVQRWYFTKQELVNSPSLTDGVDPEKELRYRQDAASLIQEMGPRLGLNPLCVSTAIVYMHRFYMINSFKAFDRGIIATAALFLAAKVEELPKQLEYVAKCSYGLLHRDAPSLEVPSEAYNKIVEDITFHEMTILQTLGFDVQVKHPHPHVVECMNLVGVSKDLSQAAFFLAHNSQLLTTFCLQYPPTIVACMCIHLTCVWKGLEIPRSNDNKHWWEYVDKSVTQTKLEELAKEFLTIVEKSPTRLKKRIQENFKMAVEGSRPHGSSGGSSSTSNSHGNRHSTAPGLSSSKYKDHHMLHPSAMFNKHHSHHQQSGTHPSSTKQPTHQHSSSKPHRTPPPPPPPPPAPITRTPSSTSANSHPHKHRKHKEHHNIPSSSITVGPSQRPDKHPHPSLMDPNNPNVKRMKMDESQQPKQHMSLNDYRSKRQQQHGKEQQQHVKEQQQHGKEQQQHGKEQQQHGKEQQQHSKGHPTSKRKPDAKTQFHSSDSHSHHLSNSHDSSKHHPSLARMHHPNNIPSLPPLPPPPLPLSHKPNHSPPPPPPPSYTNS